MRRDSTAVVLCRARIARRDPPLAFPVARRNLSLMMLPVRSPFHLEATVRLLQRRPGNRVDVWQGGRYLRALSVEGRDVLCTVRNEGTVDEPSLELTVEPGAMSRPRIATLASILCKVLGLDQDHSFAVPGARNARLRSLEQALRGARPPRFPTLFESFCRVVPYQQVSLDAGGAAVHRFVERFGRRLDSAEGPVYAFPEAQEVAAGSLRDFAGIGLSRAKIATLKNIAERLAARELTEEELERLPTETALLRLDALPGIGPWSAALVLLRGLRRMEVFPGGDVGALRALRRVLGQSADVVRLIQSAGDRRGFLYFYALGSQLLERGLIQPARRAGAPYDGASPGPLPA